MVTILASRKFKIYSNINYIMYTEYIKFSQPNEFAPISSIDEEDEIELDSRRELRTPKLKNESGIK